MEKILNNFDEFIAAVLEDARSKIIKATGLSFLKLEKKEKLTIARIMKAISKESRAVEDTMKKHVFSLIGNEDEVDHDGKPVNKNSIIVADMLFIFRKWVAERCLEILDDKDSDRILTFDVACSIVEKATTVTCKELEKYFDTVIEKETSFQEEKLSTGMGEQWDKRPYWHYKAKI